MEIVPQPQAPTTTYAAPPQASQTTAHTKYMLPQLQWPTRTGATEPAETTATQILLPTLPVEPTTVPATEPTTVPATDCGETTTQAPTIAEQPPAEVKLLVLVPQDKTK